MMTLCPISNMLTASALPEAKVARTGATPRLFIDGRADPGLLYMTYRPDAANFEAMGRAGVHLYSFSATATESTYDLAPICMTGPETYDYCNVDARAQMLLTSDPEARFLLRVFLGTPPWWAERHPDHLVRYDPANGKPSELLEVNGKPVASWASGIWRADTAEALRCFIRHVESSSYGDRVIGYHLASGTTEEWMQWGSNEDLWGDYSTVNTAKFQSWLRERYTSEADLRAAWCNDATTFEDVAIPSRIERGRSAFGVWRDPAVSRAAIDYTLYNSWLVVDTIRYLAAVAKGETRGQRLVGAFYGYVLQLAGGNREQVAGHLGLPDMLACEDIDFLTSPTSYASREVGTGFPHAMSLIDSVKLHGKMWMDENDLRTWLEPIPPVGVIGKPGTYEGTLLQQKREFGWVLADRLGMWWFDMAGGWYDDARMLDAIDRMNTIGRSCVDTDGTPIAEVVFVVDSSSSAYMGTGNPFSGPALVGQLPLLGRIGAPFAVVELEDLDRYPPGKLYIFANCLAPTAEDRLRVATWFARHPAAVLWVGPAGICKPDQFDPDGIRDLTGFRVDMVESSAPWRVIPSGAAAEWGWTGAQSYGPDAVPGVLPVPRDGHALGVYAGTHFPGLAVTGMRGQLRVFSGVPMVPTEFLRALALHAGVHLYIDTPDIVWAGGDLLTISVCHGGPRCIRLPRPSSVVDLWTGEIMADNAAAFEATIPDGDTLMCRLTKGPLQA